LKAGVQLVWVPDSTTQSVTEHAADRKPKVFGLNDTLQLSTIIITVLAALLGLIVWAAR
jgi:hypothetical protein